jgi:hypothetical protein
MSGGATPLMALGLSDWLAIIAVGVSVLSPFVGKMYLDRRVYREQLRADYEHEQRKALQSLIAKHHGLLLEHGTSWHYRMGDLYENVGRGWLRTPSTLAEASHYLKSTAFRFLALVASAKKFEDEQIYVDARHVEPHELDFVRFVKAFHWVLSDVALFKSLEYNANYATDNFFSDPLRGIVESFCVEGRIPTFREFKQGLKSPEYTEEIDQVFSFFEDLSKDEKRLRWDRLVCLHLITIAFLNQFGYSWQKPGAEEMRLARDQLQHEAIAMNLKRWLPVLGLEETPGGKQIEAVLAKGLSTSSGTRPRPLV